MSLTFFYQENFKVILYRLCIKEYTELNSHSPRKYKQVPSACQIKLKFLNTSTGWVPTVTSDVKFDNIPTVANYSPRVQSKSFSGKSKG